jgi:hypothetical protein
VKLPRLLAVWFLTLGTSFFFTPSAQAESTGPATITCAKDDGTQRTANVSWDNANQYFNGKGDIARLFCEGGHSGGFPVFVSTSVPDGPLRYYNGVAPIPTPSPTPSPSSEPTPEPSPTQPEPSPSPTDGTTATATPEPVIPTPSPEPTNTAPLPEPSPTPSDTSTANSDTSTATVEPTPVVPETQPTPEPLPIPVPVPVTPPEPTPQPQPEPLPQPEPAPEPVEPAPEPAPEPVEIAPEPAPTPEPEPPVEEEAPPLEEVPGPVTPEPAPEPAPEPPAIEPEPPVVATEDSTPEERAVVAEALIEAADGKPVTAQAIQDAGLTYEDLPPDTPVEVRQDENGNEVVITAEVAAALVVLESPAALVEALFTDPGQALLALASIGADMSEEERAESEKIIVASVIAGQAAVNASAMAAAAAYRRNP